MTKCGICYFCVVMLLWWNLCDDVCILYCTIWWWFDNKMIRSEHCRITSYNLLCWYLCVFNSKQLVEMRRLDVKSDLSLADLVLTRHPKSEATFAHRLEISMSSFLFNISYFILLLCGELLAERCHTDDLMPSISLLCLPPCCVNPKILWL